MALLVLACGDDAEGDGEAAGTGGEDSTGADTTGMPDPTQGDGDGGTSGSTGAETGGEVFDPESFVLSDVYGVPNLDDDDEDGRMDWLQFVFDGDNDVSALEVPGVPEGYAVEWNASGNVADFRVWQGETFAIGVADDGTADSYTFEPGPDGITLDVEFGSYGAAGSLQVRLLGPEGDELSVQDIAMLGAPMVMNHHLQPSERIWVMDVDADWGNNTSMVAAYADVLGDMFSPVDDAQYGFDVWVQDEIEFATAVGAGGQRLNTIIDSVRDRGLDPLPENEIVGPDFIAQAWGSPQEATTWDSFGNLEASPPVVVDGVEYPFGRIYYGREGIYGLQDGLADVLAAQRVQAPFEVDTLWLCVGHVDEFSSFVPDPDSEKGFKFLVSDVDAAIEILESLPPNMELTRYGLDHGFDTVGDMLGDAGFLAFNEDLQADELDPIREQFIAELGLEESDIIRVPSLFEDVEGCGAAALIPGMVNLIVSNPEDGPIDLFVPDPFFRANVNDQAADPFIEAFTAAMPNGITPHYVDNWDVYHLALGEVHCGTNVLRTPVGEWWTSAMHLLEGSR